MNSSFKECWREIKQGIYAEKTKQAKILQMCGPNFLKILPSNSISKYLFCRTLKDLDF